MYDYKQNIVYQGVFRSSKMTSFMPETRHFQEALLPPQVLIKCSYKFMAIMHFLKELVANDFNVSKLEFKTEFMEDPLSKKI